MKKFLLILIVLGLAYAGYYMKQHWQKKETSDHGVVPVAQASTEPGSGQSHTPGSTVVTTPETSEQPTESSVELNSDSATMTDGISLYHQKKFPKALEVLQNEFRNAKEPHDKARLLAYVAKTYEYLGQLENAQNSWNLILKDYTQSSYCGDAYYFLAQQQAKQGLLPSSMKSLENAVAYYNKSIGGLRATLELAEYHLQNSHPAEVWKYYSLASRANLPNATRKKIKTILDPIVAELKYKTELTGYTLYTVQSGDILIKIAKKLKTSVCMIRNLNGKQNDQINPKDTLKIIPGNLQIEVYKSSYFLVVYLQNGLYYQSHEVGLGKSDKTPVGTFSIKTKEKEPVWWGTDEQGRKIRVPYGDPRNVLGTRWMGFNHDGIGIHGTAEPDSIGKSRSNGCVRMRNEDVEKLYEIAEYGTQVTIYP